MAPAVGPLTVVWMAWIAFCTTQRLILSTGDGPRPGGWARSGTWVPPVTGIVSLLVLASATVGCGAAARRHVRHAAALDLH